MKWILGFMAFILIGSHMADAAPPKKGREVYVQTNSLGYKQYHKDRLVRENGRFYRADSLGHVKYHEGSFRKVEGKRR